MEYCSIEGCLPITNRDGHIIFNFVFNECQGSYGVLLLSMDPEYVTSLSEYCTSTPYARHFIDRIDVHKILEL